jgi:hypothetical protein
MEDAHSQPPLPAGEGAAAAPPLSPAYVAADEPTEPLFNFSRFSAALSNIPPREFITCLAVHPKFIVRRGWPRSGRRTPHELSERPEKLLRGRFAITSRD